MTKFKVGDKVRILDVGKIGGAREYFKNGDTTHVMEVAFDGCPYLYCNDGDHDTGLYVVNSEYSGLESLSTKPSKSERISLLESQVADLTAKVEALQKPTTINVTQHINGNVADVDKLIEGLRQKRKPATVIVKSPNEQRKATIERAKAFVTEHTVRKGVAGYATGVNFHSYVCDVQFIVNLDKRAVTLLAKGVTTGKVRARAIAKCAPDDVFNADIGKAIALGRALGLDVSEFENAVKPTEFAAGQVMTYRGRKQKIAEIDGDKARINPGDFHWTYRVNEREYVIIDDTEAQY